MPSEGTGMVECFNDPDRNGVFKIASTSQKVAFVQSDGTHKNVQLYDLSGLELEDLGA